jgi:hypothetical protein
VHLFICTVFAPRIRRRYWVVSSVVMGVFKLCAALLACTAIVLATPVASPPGYGQPPSYGNTTTPIEPNPRNGHWVDTWTSMPQLTEFANLPPPPFVSNGHSPGLTTFRTCLTCPESNEPRLLQLHDPPDPACHTWYTTASHPPIQCIWPQCPPNHQSQHRFASCRSRPKLDGR